MPHDEVSAPLAALKRPSTAIAFSKDGVPRVEIAEAYARSQQATAVASPARLPGGSKYRGLKPITKRSGRARDDDVVLVLGPDITLLNTLATTSSADLIIAEWPTTPLRWFGKFVGALDIESTERMEHGTTDDTLEHLESLLISGNNAWTAGYGADQAKAFIRKMKSDGTFNAEMIVGFMIASGVGESAIGQLEKIMKSEPPKPRTLKTSVDW